MPCLIRHRRGTELAAITLGHPLLDEYLAFVAARARTNTWLAVASDLKIFFGVVAKEPTQVNAADVFAFLAVQRTPRLGERVVRLEDGEAGLAARTVAVGSLRSAPRVRCPSCCRPPRLTRWWRRCGRTATGPWSRRWCWAGCGAARCSACGSMMVQPGGAVFFIPDARGGAT